MQILKKQICGLGKEQPRALNAQAEAGAAPSEGA